MPAVEPQDRPLSVAALTTRGRARRMLLVVNPHAAGMTAGARELVLEALRSRYHVETVDTQRKGHAIELCRDAATDGFDVVVTFGGDGTVNEAANGLAGTATPLTPLPGGSANVFARILGIPNDVVDATQRLLRAADDWRPRRVDLARANDRWFTFSAGVGLDASVVKRVDRRRDLKARFGPWYFTQSALATFIRRYVVRPPRLEVSAAGRTHTGVTAMVQNAHPYTYFGRRPIELAEGAALDSADLSAVLLTRAHPVDMPTVIWRAFSSRRRIVDHRRVVHLDGVPDVRIRSLDGRPVPLQVDGDHIGDERDVAFSVAPAALTVIA